MLTQEEASNKTVIDIFNFCTTTTTEEVVITGAFSNPDLNIHAFVETLRNRDEVEERLTKALESSDQTSVDLLSPQRMQNLRTLSEKNMEIWSLDIETAVDGVRLVPVVVSVATPRETKSFFGYNCMQEYST